ncbi:MAG: T9SS type A sorting domain-containing protein [Bacteroidota bacterium]
MKKIIFALLLIISSVANAKVVHFVVDMSQQTVNVTGVHVVGDFQTIAGFTGGDWNSASTVMTQMSSDTNMYEVFVNVPAFAKYEYKFVNGDQFYEAEFVPVESRVGYNFNDNRWIYVDSISNDTSFVGAILFAGNAPANKFLVRYLVDLSAESAVNTNGVHLIGDYQAFNPITNILYSFGANVYEVINYVDGGTYHYKFVNGNSLSDVESVPTACSDITGYRGIITATDIVLPADCFGGCGACSTSGLSEHKHDSFNLFPNPVQSDFSIRFVYAKERKITIVDENGKRIDEWTSNNAVEKVNTNGLTAGKYLVRVLDIYANQVESSSFVKVN